MLHAECLRGTARSLPKAAPGVESWGGAYLESPHYVVRGGMRALWPMKLVACKLGARQLVPTG